MKKILEILFRIFAILTLLSLAALAYLNFVYLPQKVKAKGAAYLEQKSKGQIRAESIRYIPFKGIELKDITILSKKKESLLSIEKLYFNVNLWPLLLRRELDFRLDLYLPKIERPAIFRGLYQIKQRKLDMDFEIRNDFFASSQTIYGKVKALLNREEKIDIECTATARDLDFQGSFYIRNRNLHIEKFSGKILDSAFDFIGDVQNLAEPSLNIYGNLELSLAGLKNLNPEYSGIINKLDMDGHCKAEVYIASKAANPEVGLKMASSQVRIDKIRLKDISIISRMENKKLSITKCYAKLYEGELNLQASCRLNSKGLPANLDLNLFNLELNKIIQDFAGKPIPVHGRLFSLARLNAYLKQPEAVEGKAWVSVSGSNLLQLPAFEEIADILRLPELRKMEFKEASGNFLIARQQMRTDDFKITGNNMAISFKGAMDFSGNLGFDIQPSFSPEFLSKSPGIGNILEALTDSTGNFLGEIKMKGNIKQPRYSFKPIAVDKVFRKGIEEGLKQLFKFKKEKEE